MADEKKYIQDSSDNVYKVMPMEKIVVFKRKI